MLRRKPGVPATHSTKPTWKAVSGQMRVPHFRITGYLAAARYQNGEGEDYQRDTTKDRIDAERSGGDGCAYRSRGSQS